MTADRQPQADHGKPGDTSSGPTPLEQEFDVRSLYALRSAVAAHASALGLPASVVYDVVAAAHELAANAVRHGAGAGRLRLQAADGVLVCQVSDDGPDPAGQNGSSADPAAPWPVQHGHGLWLVDQVADQFAIDHGPAGTTASATFALRPPR